MATIPTMVSSVSPPVKKRRGGSYRWTYDEYQRLASVSGLFRHRVELIGGRILEMAPLYDLNAASVELTKRALQQAFGPGFWVRDQIPLHLDKWSGPQPDIAVVSGGPRDYVGTGHPKSARLVVEVSDSTLRRDRKLKGPRYARAGYADYWIVNLVDRQVEIYRRPIADPSASVGWRYADVTVLKPPATIAPLAAPTAPVAMADLLP
jgi:Uma2 family endonuclease